MRRPIHIDLVTEGVTMKLMNCTISRETLVTVLALAGVVAIAIAEEPEPVGTPSSQNEGGSTKTRIVVEQSTAPARIDVETKANKISIGGPVFKMVTDATPKLGLVTLDGFQTPEPVLVETDPDWVLQIAGEPKIEIITPNWLAAAAITKSQPAIPILLTKPAIENPTPIQIQIKSIEFEASFNRGDKPVRTFMEVLEANQANRADGKTDNEIKID